MSEERGNRALGLRLKAKREHLGLSLVDVATKVGLAKSHVWSIEQGKTGVTIERLAPILQAYGLSWSWLDSECQHSYACVYCGEAQP